MAIMEMMVVMVVVMSNVQPLLCTKTVETCTVDNVCFQGSVGVSNSQRQFESYQGIPYATPPVADLRFLSPEPYQYKAGERVDVSGDSRVMCTQLVADSVTGELLPLGVEDCLKLNVYVPDTMDDVLLPVMVWIHGGGLETGSNNFVDYGPTRLLDKDVVVVSINYRLGPFGYLSLGSSTVPGNAGMLDQVLALQWVRDNIGYFHGDPSLVTVFGESAGSASIAYHLLSPLSRGLFQRGILQSGTALGLAWGGYIPSHKALQYSQIFSANLHCPQGDLACLQSKESSEVIMQTFLLDIPGNALENFGTAWMPVMDAEFTEESFLPGNPQDLLTSGQFNSDAEIIIGSNRNEGLLWMIGEIFDDSLYANISADWDMYGPMRIFNIADPNDITPDDIEKARAFLKFYTGEEGSFEKQYFENLVDMFTDSFALFGIHQTMKAFVANDMKVFHYILTYEGEFSLLNIYGLPPMGVCHADDLFYLFDPIFGNSGWDSNTNALTGTDIEVSELMVSAWANFAAYGDPTPPSDMLESAWLPVGKDNFQYLNISGPSPQMEYSEDIGTRMQFWTELMG
jgi:carboxylesterase type B